MDHLRCLAFRYAAGSRSRTLYINKKQVKEQKKRKKKLSFFSFRSEENLKSWLKRDIFEAITGTKTNNPANRWQNNTDWELRPIASTCQYRSLHFVC